jgi:signal transduction histidine kinase
MAQFQNIINKINQNHHSLKPLQINGWKTILLFLLVMMMNFTASAQSQKALQLELVVYKYNNAFKYDSSIAVINQFSNEKTSTADDKYFSLLYLSFVYKRLFNYEKVFVLLDSAIHISSQNQKNRNSAKAEKAYALFDVLNYKAANKIMTELSAEHYQYLTDEAISKLMMQEAYILYLEKKYPRAESLYDQALVKMKVSNPCNVPIIYAKKMLLYGALKNKIAIEQNFKLAIAAADSCGIYKYFIYTYQMMATSMSDAGEYKSAFIYQQKYDSLKDHYDTKEHLDKVTNLELKYDTENKNKKIAEQKLNIEQNKFEIVALLGAIVFAAVMLLLYFYFKRRKEAAEKIKQQEAFTQQLFANTEKERSRIAGELHDSINHELLSLKNAVNSQQPIQAESISKIIEEVRTISRDLYPAMFETMGLKASIESLCQRITASGHLFLSSEINYQKQLSTEFELQLYRIIQEFIQNTLKHSKAKSAKISITTDSPKISLIIQDNGKGFDVNEQLKKHTSFGLQSLMQRAKFLNAAYKINSNNNGTTLHITLNANHV